jgi:cell division control protein 6
MSVYALNLTEKLLLLAIIVETDYGSSPTSMGKVYARYVELSKLCNVEPATRRRVLDVLKNLTKTGILRTRVHSFGRYGKTTLILLLQPPSTLCPVLVEDLIVGEVAEEICRGTGR